jgi:triacylglycerol lipase
VIAPVPVLLVPGWSATVRLLAPLHRRLVEAGWSENRVMTLDFADPKGSNREHAREISMAVEALLQSTDAERVDIVAHSMGGLSTRLYLDEGGAARVRRAVFVATPHRGTYAAYLAFGRGRHEMVPGSELLRELDQRLPVPPGVEAVTIRTPMDVHVVPHASAVLPGVRDVRFCCLTHRGLVRSRRAFRVIHRFLAEGETAAVERP